MRFLFYLIVLCAIVGCTKTNVQVKTINDIVCSIDLNGFDLLKSDSLNSDYSASKTITEIYYKTDNFSDSTFFIWKYKINSTEECDIYDTIQVLENTVEYVQSKSRLIHVESKGIKYINDRPFVYVIYNQEGRRNIFILVCFGKRGYSYLRFINFKHIDIVYKILNTFTYKKLKP